MADLKLCCSNGVVIPQHVKQASIARDDVAAAVSNINNIFGDIKNEIAQAFSDIVDIEMNEVDGVFLSLPTTNVPSSKLKQMILC